MKSTVNGSRTKGSTQKITNNTRTFGIMGGLAPHRNVRVSTLQGYRKGHATLKQRIPLSPGEGLNYMFSNNLLSRNPQCSGGVGRMSIFAGRGKQSLPYNTKSQLHLFKDNNEQPTSMISPHAFMDSSLAFMDSCIIDDNIYIIGGGTAPGWYSTNKVYVYSVTDGLFSKNISSMKEKRFGHGIVTSSDKKTIYSLGGSSGFASLLSPYPEIYTCLLETCEKYDILTDTWSYISPMPDKRVLHGTVQVNNSIYVIGGNSLVVNISENSILENSCTIGNHGITNTCKRYDISTNTWNEINDMTTNRAGHAIVTYDMYIYVLGGCGNLDAILNPTVPSYVTSMCEVYDISENKWNSISKLNTARCLHQAVQKNGIIYVIGGLTIDGDTNKCEIYDISSGVWSDISNMNNNRASHTAVVHDNFIFVFGGWNTDASDSNKKNTLTSIEVYNINNKTWTTVNNQIMPYTNSYTNSYTDSYIDKKAAIFVQADGSDGKTYFETLQQLTYYKKYSNNPDKYYFDKIIIFAANIDYGQDISGALSKNCWQNKEGCSPNITLSLNNTLHTFFQNKKSLSLLQQLRNGGSKIYLGILGNHASGGMGGFTDVSSANNFVKSIETVFNYYDQSFNNMIDGLVIDDEYSINNNRCANQGCNSYKNFGDAITSIRNDKNSPLWCKDIGLTWNNGPPSPPTTTLSDIIDASFTFNFIIPTSYSPAAASIPEQLCNKPIEASVYNVGIGCKESCIYTNCNKLYSPDYYPMNKWFFTIQLQPDWNKEQYYSSLSTGGLQDKMGICFFTYKYNESENTALKILNDYLKLYGINYYFNKN
tara:strand:+ start:6 stop:2468 length:2463 start_codon:yes stop_codon:yes gene_type:complete